VQILACWVNENDRPAIVRIVLRCVAAAFD
jgi:hypothetical protein